MSKADLKSAMESLQVRKPLRLPSRTPVFTPPKATEVNNPTLVEIQTQVPVTTELAKATTADDPTKVATATQVLDETRVGDTTEGQSLTQVEMATVVETVTPVDNRTPTGNPTSVSGETKAEEGRASSNPVATGRRSTEQDSSVVFEAQSHGKLDRGYTRIPNALLMRLVAGDLTRNEIKLALLIARFTISFQRKRAPLSKAVLERQTGLRGPAILEALSRLVSKGVVEKEKGDQHRPNLLGLILPEGWESPGKPESPTPAESPTKVVNPTSAEVKNRTEAEVGNPTYYKDKERYLNKISLSELPETLLEYFSELKPAKKRETEWLAYQELTSQYATTEIAECFNLVQTRGVPSSNRGVRAFERCHSPMAFLTKAISTVLSEILADRTRVCERELREQKEGAERRKRAEVEAREAHDWLVKERAFEQSFSSETDQLSVLTEILQMTDMPFKPDTAAGRAFGIGRWWDGLSAAQRIEFG